MSEIKTRKRPGLLVKTASGHKGRTFNDDDLIKGKQPVYLLDDNFKMTGKKLLCNPENLQSYGSFD